MGSLFSKKKRANYKATASENHQSEQDVETAIDKLGETEEKLYSEIEEAERELKETSDERRKQSLRMRLQGKERRLESVQQQREKLERVTQAQTMRLSRIGKRRSKEVQEEVDKATRTNNKVLSLRRIQESGL